MRLIIIVVLSGLVVACTSSRYSMVHDKAPVGEFDASRVPDAIPKWEPLSPKGNQTPYTVRGKEYHLLASAKGYREEGVGSWYGLKFHGELTSNGEIYNMYSMTAAHKTLPLPSYLKVSNLENNKSVIVRVNDRGPFHDGRVIDLSYAAAKKLGYQKKGTAKLLLESIVVPKVVGQGEKSGTAEEDRLSFFVQVAALSNQVAASALLQKVRLLDLGVDSFVSKAQGREIYRVRLGPVDDQSLAEQLRRAIDKQRIGSPIVISRPVLAKGS